MCSYFRANRYKRFAWILIFTPFVAANGGGTEVPETPMLPCFMRFEYPRVILNTPVENLNTLTYEK